MSICARLLSTTIYLYCYGCEISQCSENWKTSGGVRDSNRHLWIFFFIFTNLCTIQNFFSKSVYSWTFLRKSSHLKIFNFCLYFRALCDSIYRLVMCKECLIKIDLELIGAWDCLQYIHSNYSALRNKSRGF